MEKVLHPVELAHLREAVALAEADVRDGGIPFAGLVVSGDTVIGRGINRVRAQCDPTAHAEVVAIRDACRHAQTHTLTGATLVASAEPCALCLLAAAAARVARVIYAAHAETAAEAGFDYMAWRTRITAPETWPLEIVHAPIPEAKAPFRAYMRTRQA